EVALGDDWRVALRGRELAEAVRRFLEERLALLALVEERAAVAQPVQIVERLRRELLVLLPLRALVERIEIAVRVHDALAHRIERLPMRLVAALHRPRDRLIRRHPPPLPRTRPVETLARQPPHSPHRPL